MMLNDRLRQLVALLPDEGSINLPVRAVREWLDDVYNPPECQPDELSMDLTVDDIARRMGKAHSTVRGWFNDRHNAIEGAYKFHGKEWRVPSRDFQRYLERQRTSESLKPMTSRRRPRGLRLNDYKR